MQVLSISKLEALIKEYKSEGIPTEDLEEKLRQFKESYKEPVSPSQVVVEYEDDSRTIIYSTGPLDGYLSRKCQECNFNWRAEPLWKPIDES